MNDPLLMAQIVGCVLYIAASLSSAVGAKTARRLGLAWTALLIALGVTAIAAIGEFWLASVIWVVTCGIAVRRVVDEERKAARR